ncbi:hypothetical protein [Pantoea agglomerans]|uniref:hypothetical protein n=1 Tax=Enterobacter agglomerans TaxID=549 RepID=UPI002A69DBFE|nr:hypothetical protein [Pantoea agglomerans]MDY0903076.1 hypothetical protein [Pantoea agglomerans]
MLESKDYAKLFKEKITPIIEKKREADSHQKVVVEAYNKLNHIISSTIETENLSFFLKIDNGKNEIYLQTGSKIVVDTSSINFKNMTLNFFESRMGYNGNNLIIQLSPEEEKIGAKFTGGFNNERRVFSERYTLEYVSEKKEWNLCINSSNGSPLSEELFTEEGFMRILYHTFLE